MPELEEVERFGAMISKLALPETLAGNTQRLERYKLALLSAGQEEAIPGRVKALAEAVKAVAESRAARCRHSMCF